MYNILKCADRCLTGSSHQSHQSVPITSRQAHHHSGLSARGGWPPTKSSSSEPNFRRKEEMRGANATDSRSAATAFCVDRGHGIDTIEARAMDCGVEIGHFRQGAARVRTNKNMSHRLGQRNVRNTREQARSECHFCFGHAFRLMPNTKASATYPTCGLPLTRPRTHLQISDFLVLTAADQLAIEPIWHGILWW